MDSLMISTITKMDVLEGDLIIDRMKRLSVDLDLNGSDAGELLGKTALYLAVSDKLRPVPPQSDRLVTRLADYFGCTEEDITAQLETPDAIFPD